MSCSADWNFKQQCGSDTPFEVAITDPTSGDPIDLTGASAEWIFATVDAQNTGYTSRFVYSSANGKLTMGTTDGLITGELLPADTIGLVTGPGQLDVQHQMFVTLAGGQPMLVQKGVITFTAKLPTP